MISIIMILCATVAGEPRCEGYIYAKEKFADLAICTASLERVINAEGGKIADAIITKYGSESKPEAVFVCRPTPVSGETI